MKNERETSGTVQAGCSLKGKKTMPMISCPCMEWCRDNHTEAQMKARHHKDCPHVKPFLFYWEEGIDAWCPVPDNTENLVDVLCLDDGETQEIRFKRFDMTEAEMAALPEE